MALLLPLHPLLGGKAASSMAPLLCKSLLHTRPRWSKGRTLAHFSSGQPSATIVSNGYPYGGALKVEGRNYLRLDSCLVIPPPDGRKPKAVVKFLGGAFIGAIPEVTYSYLMEWLAKEGYLVVSVPYSVTFDHEKAAKEVYDRFHSCMDSLFTYGIPDAGITALDLSALPLYSVGHSNGALLQMLIGSYFDEKLPKANVIISFNNRPASEAVPYFEQFGPVVSQVMPIIEQSPVYSIARNSSGDVWKALLDTAALLIQDYDREVVVSLNKFLDQLPSVMNQVTQGTSEFKPTPLENREIFRKSYRVPRTLLVKFSVDGIDETDILADILKPRVEAIRGTIEKVTLAGNHLTPCLQDLKWEVGYRYTPADAVTQALKSLSLNETRLLARKVTDWLDDLNYE
ncbi:uncharacterized protein LOC121986265 [Zingiber officinale]|uniref:Uncharacterized protein n=1 Tax=Zingiber officinale TaxID=94328 RepID=A0A8J5GGT2_ZINOF|nr:uncharacterized protein LOC121986265 [Zingiber officinale]KAG6505610.1 hypothetical protein ZIOFF_037975 [Zingiber officinale]